MMKPDWMLFRFPRMKLLRPGRDYLGGVSMYPPAVLFEGLNLAEERKRRGLRTLTSEVSHDIVVRMSFSSLDYGKSGDLDMRVRELSVIEFLKAADLKYHDAVVIRSPGYFSWGWVSKALRRDSASGGGRC